MKFSSLKFLSGSSLKLIAVITMLIDHFAFYILPGIPAALEPLFTIAGNPVSLYFILRKIGRISLPIFCFLIAEGFQHTKNKRRYGLGLLVFAIISEIPFDLMLFDKIFCLDKQNIYFTLFLGFMALCSIECIKPPLKKFLCLAGIYVLTVLIKPDYGTNGVLLICLLHALRNDRALQTLLSLPLLSGGLAALFAFVPIGMYNGERGFIKSIALKYAFYLFYPAHIILLIIIGMYIL